MDHDFLQQLMAPIPGEHPCGEDISFSADFDEVRESRRQDDPSLAQGEWETELKIAQWPKVRQLCERILQTRSKDLQIACWYAEALTNLHGFRGLAFGVQILEVMITDFWEFFYPPFDPDGLAERAGKIAWLDKQLAITVRNISLTSKAAGAYSWLKWEESRMVENLGLKDPAAREKALAEGKLSGDAFDKAAAASGLPHYEAVQEQIRAASTKLLSLEKQIDLRFGADSPGLRELRAAVADCADVVAKLHARSGGTAEPANRKNGADLPINEDSAQDPQRTMVHAQPIPLSQIRTRQDAVGALRQVSQFFRQNEPHSPVALLADRAAKWAEMPLERWLASVIKDDSTLSQLRELLDIPREG